MIQEAIDKTKTVSIRMKIIKISVFSLLILGTAFFLPARTFRFWEAWIYLCIIFSCITSVILYFLKHDPDFLERRIKTKETVKEQKLIIMLGWLLFLPTFLIPGFDRYYSWSDVPVYLVIASDMFVLSGYLLIIRVFRENSYASRVIEVAADQMVISTGPYAIVRHPMYSGSLLMYLFTPVALGSYWGLIGSGLIFILIIFRIFSEEKYLAENLKGYKEYLLKIKYRLIPGIW